MSDIELTFDAPLARIRLNSAARRNAISRAMWRALPDIRAAIEARADALVVVVEGAGGHFSARADISEFAEVYRDAAATRDYVDAIARGMKEESPAFRAAVEDAALGEDFLEGRAAFAARRAPKFAFRGATSAVD